MQQRLTMEGIVTENLPILYLPLSLSVRPYLHLILIFLSSRQSFSTLSCVAIKVCLHLWRVIKIQIQNVLCSQHKKNKTKTFLKFKSKWDVLGASQGRNILIFHLRSDLSANIMEREERLIGSGGQSRIEC